MEPTWMESNSLRLVSDWDRVRYLKFALSIIPNVNETLGACNNKLFSETDIHTSDLIYVERRVHIV